MLMLRKRSKADRLVEGRHKSTDILAALFYFANRQFLTADMNRIFCAIRDAQEKCPVLKDFTFFFFSAAGHPVSRGIESALALLKLSYTIQLDGACTAYRISEGSRQYIERKILPVFTHEEQRFLKRVARLIRRRCRVRRSELKGSQS